MAYDEQLAEWVREELQADPAYSERKLFGGLCFMLHSNMCTGVVGDRLMLLLGQEAAQATLKQTHVSPMEFTGMVYVDQDGLSDSPSPRGRPRRRPHPQPATRGQLALSPTQR